MFISVILSTYESPVWLRKVIWGYAAQTHREFELVIADDGSGKSTAQCIDEMRQATQLSIRHVWQPKQGFGKCRMLNWAVMAADAEYLVFSDGDCIPRSDFLSTHSSLAAPGQLLSGGTVRLPRELSERITADDIFKARVTNPVWLVRNGWQPNKKLLMLLGRGRRGAWFDRLTTTRATFNGHNTSVWKKDILRVNGFDQRMGYGGLDRELGERLVNAGVRPKQIRHRAVCVHLDHSRDYVNPAVVALNQQIRMETRRLGHQWTFHGIQQEMALPRTSDKSPAFRLPHAA